MYIANTFSKVTHPAPKAETASLTDTASSSKSSVAPSVESSFQHLLQQKTTDPLLENQPTLQALLPNIPSDSEELSETLAALLLFQSPLPAEVQSLMSAPLPSPQAVPTQLPVAVPPAAELTASTVAPLPQTDVQAPFVIPAQAQAQAQAQPKAVEAPALNLLASPNAAAQSTQFQVQRSSDGDTPDFSSNSGSQTTPLFQTTEHIPVKVGDAPPLDTKSATFDTQLGRQISQALNRGEQTLSIRLAPANLGTVVVEMTRAPDGALSVLLHASSKTAANMLQDRSSELSGLLRNSTGSPVYVEVQQPQDRPLFQEQQQGNARQNSQQQQQQSPSRQQTEDFLEQLRLGITDLEPEAS